MGPGQWVDQGPGSALGGRSTVYDAIAGARNVGQMLPSSATGPTPQVKGDGTAKLGITPRWNGSPKR